MIEHLTIDTITDYIHSELTAAEDALAHEHLQRCAECRAAYDTEVRLGEDLRSALRADELELPSLVKARIWEEIRRAQPSVWTRAFGWLRPAYAIPAVALLALLTFFAHPLEPNTSATPMVDATFYLEEHAAQQMPASLGDRSSSTQLDTAQTIVSDAGPNDGQLELAADATPLYALP